MKKGIAFCLVLCCLFSCETDKPIIPPAKMKSMLLEMHLAESLAQHLPKDSAHFTVKNEDSLKQFNADILQRYHVSANDFSQSMDYYKRKPILLDSMYQDLLADMAIRQAKLK